MTLEAPSLAIGILDDDEALRDGVLVPGLRRFGFSVTGMATPAELYRTLLTRRFHIVILDVDLPDEDGITVAYHLRKLDAALGILMLSGHDEDPEKIASLECGADDYLVKPVSIELLAARVHSLWRRIAPREALVAANPNAASVSARPRGAAPVDAAAASPSDWYLPKADGSVIALAQSEQRVFAALLAAAGQPCTREALVAAITADAARFDPARLDVLVHRLRRKLADSTRDALAIVTVRGVGYALVTIDPRRD